MLRAIKKLWYTTLCDHTNKDIYFWLMMRYAYNAKPGEHFGMCRYSRLFSDRWKFNRGDILEPARLWIQTQDTSENFDFNSCGYLFFYKLGISFIEGERERVRTIKLRKDFIEHMIEQCKNIQYKKN